jgi:N-acetyl-gamma-glutamyl-phosphate reductase
MSQISLEPTLDQWCFEDRFAAVARGVLATIYCRGRATTGQCLDAARSFYAGRAFVHVTDKPPQTKCATARIHGNDLSSKPVKRRSCLGMSSGSNVASRSRGTSMRSGLS